MSDSLRKRARLADVAQEETIARSHADAVGMRSTYLPRVEEHARADKLAALYRLQGDARQELAREFLKIDRKHYCTNGVSHKEYRRMTREAIADWS